MSAYTIGGRLPAEGEGSDVKTEEGRKALSLACQSGLNAVETEMAVSLAVRGGLKEEQRLASFDKRTRNDPELDQWIRPRDRSRKALKLKQPFFLFKMKASAKKARVSWWMKKYDMFPPERPGYTYASRVARLVIAPDGGFRLEQAGEGGQPGALSYHTDTSYKEFSRPIEGVFKEGLREVAVIQRLPGGEGISIMSHVVGLGVKLGDILFVLHCSSVTVALSFTEREFYVSSKFTEESLYASADLDFIDIAVPVENLIKKLYQMYELEERDKQKMQENQGDHEVQKRKKLEVRQRRRAERKKYDGLRKEMKSMVQQMKQGASVEGIPGQHEEFEDICFSTPMRSLFREPEPDLAKPSEDELCQSEEMCKESLEEAMKLNSTDGLDGVSGSYGRRGQSLGEDIRELRRGQDVKHLGLTESHTISNKVQINLHMFRPLVLHGKESSSGAVHSDAKKVVKVSKVTHRKLLGERLDKGCE
uniref:Uncharacterized protein n=1 Tax=Aegilops tauschii TaxID=37682 RepID=M8AH58_AEGTA